MTKKLEPKFYDPALRAAMVATPMIGDTEIYNARIADFVEGYRAGRKKALEECANVVRSLERKSK